MAMRRGCHGKGFKLVLLGDALGGEIQHFDALLAQQVLRRNRPSSDDGMIWDDQFAVSIMGSSHKTI